MYLVDDRRFEGESKGVGMHPPHSHKKNRLSIIQNTSTFDCAAMLVCTNAPNTQRGPRSASLVLACGEPTVRCNTFAVGLLVSVEGGVGCSGSGWCVCDGEEQDDGADLRRCWWWCCCLNISIHVEFASMSA